MRERFARDRVLARGLGGAVVLLKHLVDVGDAVEGGVHVGHVEAAFAAELFDDLAHFGNGRAAAGGRAGLLRELVFVDVLPVVAQHALGDGSRAIALLPLVHHRHVEDPDVAAGGVLLHVVREPVAHGLRGNLHLGSGRHHREPHEVHAEEAALRRLDAPRELRGRIGLRKRLHGLLELLLALELARLGLRRGPLAVQQFSAHFLEQCLEFFLPHAASGVARVEERKFHARDALGSEVQLRLVHGNAVPHHRARVEAVDDVALLGRELEAVVLVVDREVHGRRLPGVRLRERFARVERGLRANCAQRREGAPGAASRKRPHHGQTFVL